jgi:hypothetical protein
LRPGDLLLRVRDALVHLRSQEEKLLFIAIKKKSSQGASVGCLGIPGGYDTSTSSWKPSSRNAPFVSSIF